MVSETIYNCVPKRGIEPYKLCFHSSNKIGFGSLKDNKPAQKIFSTEIIGLSNAPCVFAQASVENPAHLIA